MYVYTIFYYTILYYTIVKNIHLQRLSDRREEIEELRDQFLKLSRYPESK